MDFPPKRGHQRRLQLQASQSTPEIRVKLMNLVSRHEQVKIAHHNLKSHIENGLLQAKEVFASLATPLMKLVGLKTMEMAEEGRFTTIFFDADYLRQEGQREAVVCDSTPILRTTAADTDQRNDIRSSEEDIYAAKATKVGKEFLEKQQMQLIQLVEILKKIETQVNSHESDMVQNLANYRASLHKFFQKAIHCISALHSQNHDTFLPSLKILRIIFDNMNVVLGSVEDGIENLMQALAGQMCDPMVKYVNNLKADLKIGTCARLMTIMEEVERATGARRLELEEARKRVRIAEEDKMKALCRLKQTEDRVTRMKGCLGLLLEARKEAAEPFVAHKSVGLEKGEANDDKLLWGQLEKKGKHLPLESPKECFAPNYKHSKPTQVKQVSHRPLTRSQSRLNPQTKFFNTRIPLGSSPSAANRQAIKFNKSSARAEYRNDLQVIPI